MTIRTFVFCDICNPQWIRTIEFRRSPRTGERSGRRLCDGRFWFEGSLTDAIKNGWADTAAGQHTCPNCKKTHKDS